ncbi:hypothetical protein D3C71_2008810 [compost metagenome]
MLQNMKDSCAVLRRSPKAYAEHLIVILILHKKQSCTALLMLHREYGGFDFPDKFLTYDLKSRIDIAYFQAAHRFPSSI